MMRVPKTSSKLKLESALYNPNRPAPLTCQKPKDVTCILDISNNFTRLGAIRQAGMTNVDGGAEIPSYKDASVGDSRQKTKTQL